MKIARQGYPFVIIPFLIALISVISGFLFLSIIFIILALFTAYFFRNPQRNIPQVEGAVVAPADGKVIKIDQCFKGKLIKEDLIKISIFMTIFNVHINRIPISGKVIDIFYNPGKFFAANVDKSSYLNEQNAVILETKNQKKVLFVQIAGLIARRIACWVKKGNQVFTGQKFGMIYFGSRVDLYLPLDSIINIQVGQKVKGGETIVGYVK